MAQSLFSNLDNLSLRDIESEADNLLDFTEGNPFGDY